MKNKLRAVIAAGVIAIIVLFSFSACTNIYAEQKSNGVGITYYQYSFPDMYYVGVQFMFDADWISTKGISKSSLNKALHDYYGLLYVSSYVPQFSFGADTDNKEVKLSEFDATWNYVSTLSSNDAPDFYTVYHELAFETDEGLYRYYAALSGMTLSEYLDYAKENSDEPTIENGFFYNTLTQKISNPTNGMKEAIDEAYNNRNASVPVNIYSYIFGEFSGLNGYKSAASYGVNITASDFADVKYGFVYADNYYSGCDGQTGKVSGIAAFSWSDLPFEYEEQPKLKLYRRGPVVATWVVLGIVITAGVSAALYFIFKAEAAKKRRDNSYAFSGGQDTSVKSANPFGAAYQSDGFGKAANPFGAAYQSDTQPKDPFAQKIENKTPQAIDSETQTAAEKKPDEPEKAEKTAESSSPQNNIKPKSGYAEIFGRKTADTFKNATAAYGDSYETPVYEKAVAEADSLVLEKQTSAETNQAEKAAPEENAIAEIKEKAEDSATTGTEVKPKVKRTATKPAEPKAEKAAPEEKTEDSATIGTETKPKTKRVIKKSAELKENAPKENGEQDN